MFDIEQLIREKDERITSGSQLMNNIVNAQYWQLVGAEAPDQVPIGLRPKANQVIAPGAGNRIEGISPWMPEFQLEQFLTRIDREMVDVSGLNDLLRGLAPAQVMSSCKSINALIANYETRISMKRDIFYKWRQRPWYIVRKVWANEDQNWSWPRSCWAGGRLDIVSPSLTPRDDMETAQIARTLVDGKLWSACGAWTGPGSTIPRQSRTSSAPSRPTSLSTRRRAGHRPVGAGVQAMGYPERPAGAAGCGWRAGRQRWPSPASRPSVGIRISRHDGAEVVRWARPVGSRALGSSRPRRRGAARETPEGRTPGRARRSRPGVPDGADDDQGRSGYEPAHLPADR